jgi:hypothetical protein
MLFFTSLSFELARLHIPHCHVINIYFVLLLLIGIDQQLCDIESDVRLGTQSKEELISQTFRENVTASTADEKVFITMEPVVLSGSQCKHWLVLRCPNCSGLSTSRSRLKIFSSAHSSLFFLSPSCWTKHVSFNPFFTTGLRDAKRMRLNYWSCHNHNVDKTFINATTNWCHISELSHSQLVISLLTIHVWTNSQCSLSTGYVLSLTWLVVDRSCLP